jgi:uncharacterized membrane protein YgdD (TMEM256/DUF423 family)
MKKNLLLAGTLFALLSVLLGAMGSHALKPYLSPEDFVSYDTAVRYQMYHALAILFTALFMSHSNTKYCSIAGMLFAFGIVLFSGSLYFITYFKTQGITISPFIGMLTPLGGLMLACGWLMLAVSIFKHKP